MQSYKRGKADGPVAAVRDCDPQLHGTKVHFLPDAEIFEETVYDYNTLKQRLRETAFLTKGLCITLKDTREESQHNHKFHYAGGIKEFVEYLNRGKEPLYPEVIYCEGNRDGVYVEVAMQHNDSFNDSTYPHHLLQRLFQAVHGSALLHGHSLGRDDQIRGQCHAGYTHLLHERHRQPVRSGRSECRYGTERYRRRHPHRFEIPLSGLRIRRLLLPERCQGPGPLPPTENTALYDGSDRSSPNSPM